jgi:hypothetical protein
MFTRRAADELSFCIHNDSARAAGAHIYSQKPHGSTLQGKSLFSAQASITGWAREIEIRIMHRARSSCSFERRSARARRLSGEAGILRGLKASAASGATLFVFAPSGKTAFDFARNGL